MKNPLAFTIATLIVLLGAGLIFYFYGLPMLGESSIGCRSGGGGKTLGCMASFGTFMTLWFAAVAFAIAVIWSRFGR
jgi:hypothetical protein